ncbi:MAG: hypothetical protein JSR76_01010 [Verrucomicrobia bacterium]|nr:hypothetical protein [Verrucomicrobiota bacterium]
MLTDEGRRYILNEFLADISGIADIDYQKRIWILAEGPECDDFGETRCRFFGTASAILEEYKKFGGGIKVRLSDKAFNNVKVI